MSDSAVVTWYDRETTNVLRRCLKTVSDSAVVTWYDRETTNVLRRCLKTVSDSAAVTWYGRSFYVYAPETGKASLPVVETN